MSRKRRRGWVMAALSFIVLIVSLVHADHDSRRGRHAAPAAEVHAPANHAPANAVAPAGAVVPVSAPVQQDRKKPIGAHDGPVAGPVARFFD